MKYTAEVLEEARELIEDGITINAAAEYLGFSRQVMYYNFSPAYKKVHVKAARRWQAKNRERYLSVMRDYSKNRRVKK